MERTSLVVGGVFSAIIPFACAVIAAALANLPVSLSGDFLPPPLLALMPLYFWCLVRPDLMPPWTAFVIGLLQDLFSGAPPGVWAAGFVVTYAIVDRARESFAGLSGWGAVLGFSAAALAASLTGYLLFALFYLRLPPVEPVLGTLAVTVILFVPAAFVLGVIHRRLVGPQRMDI